MHKMYNKIVISVEHLLSAQIGRDKFEGVATGCRLWLWLWLWDLSLGLPAQLSINAVACHGMASFGLAWLGSTRLPGCASIGVGGGGSNATRADNQWRHGLPLKETGPAAAQRENAC